MGRYTPVKEQSLKTPPTKNPGESEQASLQRLRQWNIARNRGGSKIPGAAPKKPTEKKEDSGSWMDRVVRALK